MAFSPASKSSVMRPIQGAAGRSPLAPRTSSLRVMVLSAHSGGSDSWGNNPAWRSEHEHTREGRRAEYKARWAQAMEAARHGDAQRTEAQNQSQWSTSAAAAWQQQQPAAQQQPLPHHQPHHDQSQHHHHHQQHHHQAHPAHGGQFNAAAGHALQHQQPSASDSATADVRFNLKFCTSFGESLRIIGSAPGLGAWNLSQAPTMQWGMGDMWTATIPLPQSSVQEYKYVLVGADGAPLKWQQGNNNVLAVKPDQANLEVHDNWDGGQGSSVVSTAGSVTRENQLLSWANEIEAKMSTTKNELKQWRGELSAAKEEAKVARIEVANLKTELGIEKERSKQQTVEIQALKQENSDLKSQLGESAAGFEQALQTASLLMSEIDEVPPIPPMSGQTNGHPQAPQGGHQGAQYDASWHEWQQAATAGGQHPSTSAHDGHGYHQGRPHEQPQQQQQQQHDQWNGSNSYNAGYHSYSAGSAAGGELRWAGDQQGRSEGGEHQYSRSDQRNGHSRHQ
mmetsp:Transcript_39777/g.100878  ORF Transcript_39777/g.100878 Transcript_39777/m.100878 type:complete len:508 (+) Transcript_39777:241-1764(+)